MEARPHIQQLRSCALSAAPFEEPTGPAEDDTDMTTDILESSFRKYAGSEGKVDAFGLRSVLSDIKKEEYGASDGYSLETCRSLISLHDVEVEGMMDLTRVRKAWETVKLWTRAFRSFDLDNTKSIQSSELGAVCKEIGFSVSDEVLKAVVRRYGGRDGEIKEDDFIQSSCKITTLHDVFREHACDEKISVDLNDWFKTALYI